MQQNRIKFLELLGIFILIFNSACNSDLTLNTENYYDSSTLKRWNLKGKVKSVSINNDDKVFDFNTDGYVTKITFNQYGSFHVYEYNYNTEGKLQNIVSYFKDRPQSKSTETYAYENTDRLVLKQPDCLVTNFSTFDTYQIINDLVLGLKSVTNQFFDLNYYFVDDTLYLCRKATINNTLINDTTKVTYNGKYPVNYTVLNSFFNVKAIYKDIVFSNHGNLLYFTEEIIENDLNISKRTYYYKPNYPDLLLDSIVNESEISRSVDKYIYNSKMDLYQQIGNGIEWKYDYRYDSHGNWTTESVKSKSNNSGIWEKDSTTTRVIKYW